MKIKYFNDKKDLPSLQLHKLFLEAGWSKGDETDFMMEHFNLPFINSTIVISAWDGDKLVGCVRAISDKVVRSVIQDFVVAKKYRNRGIGTALLNRCISAYPDSEWLVPTTKENAPFYQSRGFKVVDSVFLRKQSRWF